MFKRVLLHKSKGNGFGEMLGSTLGIIQLAVMVLFFIGTIQVLNRQINMDSVIRGYMLQLESQGYLSEKQQNQLKDDLTKLGAYNGEYKFGETSYNYEIKIEGWDPANAKWQESAIGKAAGYGSRVGLRVTMTVPDNEYHPQYWIGNVIQSKLRVREVNITKVQTAKY